MGVSIYVEESVTPCSLSIHTVLGSPLRPLTSSALHSLPDLEYHTWVHSYEVNLKSNMNVIVNLIINIQTIIIPVDISCQGGHCCSSCSYKQP